VATPEKDAIDPTDSTESANECREVDRRRAVGEARQSSVMVVCSDVEGATATTTG
jgi:hypothetical protein